ncbi:MAG: HAD-IA family hydrolase [bacterium]|nr:HAD-IA family hydrolase [bacterium]
MRYRTVLFDVGETLIGPAISFGQIYSDTYRAFGFDIPGERFERAIRGVWAELMREIPAGTDRYAHYPGGEAEYWLRFCRRVETAVLDGAPRDGLAEKALEALRAAFLGDDAWRVYDDVRPTLSALRDRGVKLGVVSNWDSRLPEILERLDLTDYFAAVGVSHFEGTEKPDPRLFRIVLDRLDAEPSGALHVGDVPELDLVGARSAGVEGVLIDRAGKYDGQHRTVSELTRVVELADGSVES